VFDISTIQSLFFSLFFDEKYHHIMKNLEINLSFTAIPFEPLCSTIHYIKLLQLIFMFKHPTINE